MKNFFLFVVALVIGALALRNYVTSGKLVAHLDAHPDRRGTATIIFYLGSFYEVTSETEKSIDLYRRVVDRYPKSQYGEGSHYGLASGLERLKRYGEAIQEYQLFLEVYPKSRKAVSVQNNINILRGR